MGYVALSLPVLTSLVVFRFWIQCMKPKVRRLKNPVHELGNARMDWDAPLTGRPDPFRVVCQSAVLAFCFLIFGLPHLLALAQFWHKPQTGIWHYIHYSWTLAYWLALLSFPRSL